MSTSVAAPVVASRKEEALWMLDRLVPSSGVNNLTMAVQADGPLGEWELGETLAALLRRHAVLRTVFRATAVGLIKQVADPAALTVTIAHRRATPDTLDAELGAFAATPFAFDGSPLVRAAHVESADGDVFVLVAHHLVFDTLSAEILAREFVRFYDAIGEGLGAPSGLDGPAPELIEPAPSAASIAYWRERLRGFDPSALDLWCGDTDIADPTLVGGVFTRRLPDRAREAVRTLQRDLRAPEAVVLLAAYALLLAGHGGGPDLAVGSPVSVRPPDALDAVGYHISTVPLRLRVDWAGGFDALVAEARESFLGALAHADVPVDLMLNEVRAERTSAWRNPVFKHVFNYVPDPGDGSFEAGDVRVRRRVVENGFSKFDLEFFFVSAADGLDLRVAHYTEVIGAEDAALMADRFEALLVELGESPGRPLGEVSFFGARDHAVIEAANDTGRTLSAPTVLHRIAGTVAARPTEVAVEDGPDRVTYAGLWAAALATRDALRRAGVARDDTVALLCGRGAGLAASVLGVWLAGAAYLPLDPRHPERRLAFQLEDSGAAVVIADPGITVPAAGVTVLRPYDRGSDDVTPEPAAFPDPADRAYLIYTSGSTGRPKGTEIGHHSLANLVEHFAAELRGEAGETTLWMTTFSFDISALELLLPLCTGGRIAVCPDDARTDGRLLLGFLRDHEVDVVQATPTTWHMIVEEAGDGLAGRRVLTGGEPLPSALAGRLVATGGEIHNVYGPTETTIWSTSGRITDAVVHVGTPITNTRVFITGPDGRELPVGVRGELCIAGDGVAFGYHGRPDLTADRFVDHPRHGRSYRTGDVARWRPDGVLEVLGRLDRQVKVRGHRIELGEVEAVLAAHPGVRSAAALVARGGGLDGVLVGFVVPGDQPVPSDDDLWRHASHELPRPAVPARFFVVDELPMTGNAKVDYPALNRLAVERPAGARDTAPAAGTSDDPLVAMLIGLWREFVGRDDVGPATNFFAHGGHSLLGAQMVQRVEENLGVTLRLGDLFDHPTPAEFARAVEAASGREALDRKADNA